MNAAYSSAAPAVTVAEKRAVAWVSNLSTSTASMCTASALAEGVRG
jgi:hypothetical protein